MTGNPPNDRWEDKENRTDESAAPPEQSGSWVPSLDDGHRATEPVRQPAPAGAPCEEAQGEGTTFVFGEMWGAVFLAWLPVMVVFFLPWSTLFGDGRFLGSMTFGQLIAAVVIAVPPWVVLLTRLLKGRLWDGILEMFLWAIWECMAMIMLCYLYPDRAGAVIWHASDYWSDMSGWLRTGSGVEGTPAQWLPLHGTHLAMLIVGAFFGGLPALVMGVLQLNYMNYYVARCLLLSDEPLLTLPLAWHFWSVIRVAGYIVLASAMFQLFLRLVFRAPWRTKVFVNALLIGIILVLADALFKWLYAEDLRRVLSALCGF